MVDEDFNFIYGFLAAAERAGDDVDFITLHRPEDIIYMDKPANSRTIYLHNGFNPEKTRKFAESLEVFQNPEVFSDPKLLNERIQACIEGVNEPLVDVNAYYHGRPWFDPLREGQPYRKPLAFFAAAVVTAPPAIIEAMMNRQDTDVNVKTPGPEGSAGPFGMLTAHIDFRGKRDGHDLLRQRIHPDTLGTFGALFGEPRFDMMSCSFIYEDTAFTDLYWHKDRYVRAVDKLYGDKIATLAKQDETYLDLVHKLCDERNTILAEPCVDVMQAGLNNVPDAIFDKAETVVFEDVHQNRVTLSTVDADAVREAALEMIGCLQSHIDKRLKNSTNVPLTLDKEKLLAGAGKGHRLWVAERVAGTLFVEALEEVCLRKWGPDRIRFDTEEPVFYSPKYRAALKVGGNTLYAYFRRIQREECKAA